MNTTNQQFYGYNPDLEELHKKPEDWMLGSGKVEKIRMMPGGTGWAKYRPTGETQRNDYVDSQGCTGWSYENSVQYAMNWRIKNIASAEELKWLKENNFIDAAGQFNADELVLNIMAGTTQGGNSLSKIAETARDKGLHYQFLWQQRKDAKTWAEMFAPLPAGVAERTALFLTRYKLNDEWIIDNPNINEAEKNKKLKEALEYGVPWVVGAAWYGQDSQGRFVRTDERANHAFNIEEVLADRKRAFDNYPKRNKYDTDFTKDLTLDYKIWYAKQIIINYFPMETKKGKTPTDGYLTSDLKKIRIPAGTELTLQQLVEEWVPQTFDNLSAGELIYMGIKKLLKK